MKTSFILGFVLSIVFVGFSAHAEIDQNFLKGTCVKQKHTSDINQGVWVEDTARCNTYVSNDQWLELAVANYGFEKEIYIYDHGVSAGNRTLKVMYSQNEAGLYNGLSGMAMYVGKRYSGHDVFMIRLVNRPNPSAPLDIYVKMGDTQVQTTNVKTVP